MTSEQILINFWVYKFEFEDPYLRPFRTLIFSKLCFIFILINENLYLNKHYITQEIFYFHFRACNLKIYLIFFIQWFNIFFFILQLREESK